ncbi:endonuclease exonuclease phosphatase [Diaporthe amygdali]|uniref:endonuclease exonuclease phosphatase n=1 Tax=Phomopsis amygdali TaxID=1214568 RepID=UPI0022FEC117|nr:endonuclease exonuclease phosphatase [Diaporthe amygdali]KAJ0120965.1 endonuclease exonuclease phosphatase [Diaporthe amygdali]
MISKIYACLLLGAAHVYAQQPLRVVSFNIRYDNTDLSIADVERGWLGLTCVSDQTLCRAPGVIGTLFNTTSEVSNVAVIGLQETLDNQLSDIMTSFGSDWASIGVGRDDGEKKGEFNPIIYRKDVFEVEYSETKWLSLTPDTPSKSWNSGSNRIVTIAVFKHTATGRRFIHANTHLDNASGEARTNQIGVAVDLVKAVDAQYGPNLPVTLTGDFNAGDGDAAYKTLVGEKYVQDLYSLASSGQRSGETATYTGFSDEFSSRIDYIWIGPEGANAFSVNGYKTLDNFVNGVKISDHRPVVGDVTLN